MHSSHRIQLNGNKSWWVDDIYGSKDTISLHINDWGSNMYFKVCPVTPRPFEHISAKWEMLLGSTCLLACKIHSTCVSCETFCHQANMVATANPLSEVPFVATSTALVWLFLPDSCTPDQGSDNVHDIGTHSECARSAGCLKTWTGDGKRRKERMSETSSFLRQSDFVWIVPSPALPLLVRYSSISSHFHWQRLSSAGKPA